MRQLKSLIGIAIVVGAIYVAWKVFPVYYSNFEFQDYVEQQARLESYTQHTEMQIGDEIFKKAQELEIPINREDIRVQRSGPSLSVDADYTVHVEVPIHPFDLHFNAGTKNKRL